MAHRVLINARNNVLIMKDLLALQRSDLLEREQVFHYQYIISCVDKNPVRHAIQHFWPHVLFGGSTLGLGVTVQSYDMTSEFDCLMCANPISSDDWSIELQAERLRGI